MSVYSCIVKRICLYLHRKEINKKHPCVLYTVFGVLRNGTLNSIYSLINRMRLTAQEYSKIILTRFCAVVYTLVSWPDPTLSRGKGSGDY